MAQSIKKVIFDTDCLSSFLWVQREDIILSLYEGLIVIPDEVYNEISKVKFLLKKLDKLINDKKVTTMSIYYGSEEYNLFNEMTVNPTLTSKIIGKGEASAITLCKYNNGILASNNLKDILVYVKEYNLETLLTENILIEALKQSMITEQEGNNIWQNMLEKRRKLPYLTFSDCLKDHQLKIK